MPMRYVLGNYINSTTLLSVSSEDNGNGYGKENMYNTFQWLPWRMTAKTGNALFDFGTDRPTIICIMNHNFTNAATIRLAADAANPPGGGGGWGGGNENYIQVLTWNELNIWYAFSQNLPFWYLSVADAGNPYNLEIGELVLYTHGTFTRTYSHLWGEDKQYIKGDMVNPFGVRHRDKRSMKKKFSLDFRGVTGANLLGEVEDFFDVHECVDPLVFIPETTQAYCWYMYCLNSLEAKRNFDEINSFSLELEEQARGITLL